MPYRIANASWVLLAFIAAGALLGAPLAGFVFPFIHLLYLIIFAGGLGIIAFIIYSLRVKDGDLPFWFIQHLILLIPGTIFCQILLCIGASLAFPMIDARLVAIDHGLGFDWNAYVHWLAGFPALAHGLDIAYNLMVVEMGLVMCLLCIKRRFRDSERFIYAYLSALLLTAVIASLWPAVGAYGYWGIDPANLGLNPPAARIHEPDMLALRSGELRYFPLVMKGLVTFPSFHTATALLLTFAAWPLRYARLPALALNIAMIVSVLACGSHYLSDILGGIAVALAGWVLAGRILPK